MTTYHAQSEMLGIRSDDFPTFDQAAMSKPGQMPDAQIFEVDFERLSWTLSERHEGEWWPMMGGNGAVAMEFLEAHRVG